MTDNFLIELSGRKPLPTETASLGGGKFAGLNQVRQYLCQSPNAPYLNIQLPRSFAISTAAFHYFNLAQNPVPEELINQAMQAMAACGGIVAVRSSANIEDASGKTYSGVFDSVLNIRNKAQMREALTKVYASLQNAKPTGLTNPAMGIVIQPMINNPQYAGVVYSEGFRRDPYIILNYTTNQTAEKLVIGQEKNCRHLAVSKYTYQEGSSELHYFSLPWLHHQLYFNRPPENEKFYLYDKQSFHAAPFVPNEEEVKHYLPLLKAAALANDMELHFKQAIDMEFAVDNNGNLNILQQRPYVMPRFRLLDLPHGQFSYYSENRPTASGSVSIWEQQPDGSFCNPDGENHDFILINERVGNHTISTFYTPEAYTQSDIDYISKGELFSNGLYNHIGNMNRENLQLNALSLHDLPLAAILKSGDRIQIDFSAAKINRLPANSATQAKVITKVGGR